MANSEWRIGMAIERPGDQFLSGLEGVAGSHDLGGVLLSADRSISSRRDVRIDIANQASCCIRASEYCRGTWSGKHRQLRPTPARVPGVAERAGNPSTAG